MKKILLSIFVASSFAASAQNTVFEDSFETYNDFLITGYGDWQTLDLDQLTTYGVGEDFDWENNGVEQSWMVFNPSATTPPVTNATEAVDGENRNFDPHTGSKYLASWASALTDGSPQNDDFLISPPITLGATNNELTFWVKSLSDSYGLEEFRVYVISGTAPVPTTAAGFGTPISGLPIVTAPYPNWQQKTYSLNGSSNSTIRVAIRNVGDDHYMLMVDDFKVTSSLLSVNDVLAGKFSAYPNPSNGIINLTNTESIRVNSVEITDLNGRVVKTVSYTDAPSAIEININELASGMYMMNIASDQGVAVKKIMKN
ncbi:MAG TPA: choice-of-anchor J domain-containing protein [Flavobacterium sp.]|jgi:hypothetical protein